MKDYRIAVGRVFLLAALLAYGITRPMSLECPVS